MSPGWIGAWLAILVAGGGGCFTAVATAAEREGRPVLLSRTGGNAWSNVKELEAAAANGNPRAEAEFGELLLRGNGVAKDEARAVALLEKAARAGQAGAAFRMGMLLMEGAAGLRKDEARALDYFRAAAAGGEKEAFFNIGAAYGSAKGVKRDYGEALGWLIVARERGADGAAERNLRAQIKAYPSWIARGERRAKEIAHEFSGRSVAEFLPPLPEAETSKSAVPPVAPPPLAPAVAPLRPSVELRPSLPGLPLPGEVGLAPVRPVLPPPGSVQPQP
jgi:hypothetical protein